jgi:hypothetical protein
LQEAVDIVLYCGTATGTVVQMVERVSFVVSFIFLAAHGRLLIVLEDED